ncbi:unnamed protein product [Fusarium venenatum]|uniref:Uncharacterized protein n=1 Tax=Fusarium venenatum TaxID=56646 RepID=A0A2L2SU68_9HYPO|nr:LOW QUALITY PROTEIN: uncharacterized protein FVRRES_05378 [Fusarium venenatum]CEI60942.1 unnamed protein product [Fusarium venenatum]
MTGARPPAGTRGGVARLASFDRGVLMPNPQKLERGEEAGHCRILYSASGSQIDAQRHYKYQPHRFARTTNADKSTIKATNGLSEKPKPYALQRLDRGICAPQKRHQGRARLTSTQGMRGWRRKCECQAANESPPHQTTPISSMTRRGYADQQPVDDA